LVVTAPSGRNDRLVHSAGTNSPRLVDRVIVAFVGAALGIVSAVLLGLSGGPVVSGTVTLFDVFGCIGLVFSTVLLLRVVVVAIKEDAPVDHGL